MKNVLGDSYFLGNAYGTILLDSYDFFDVWTPRTWHSVCLTYTKRKLKLFVDDKIVVNISLKFDFFSVYSGNVILMKDFQNQTIKSKMTDIQIWRKAKTYEFIKKWVECQKEEEVDIFK